MTTSNSYNFIVTRDEIIELAHQHISALGEGESCTAAQITEAAKLLNMIVKLRAADGMPLWALKRGTLLPVTGVSSVATDSHVVTTYRHTTTSAAAASAASTIVVSSATGISNLDQIGVELSDGTIQWTTVNGAPAGTTVTLTAVLTGAVSSGADIYVYTASSDRIQKPIRITEADILTVSDSNSYEIRIEDRGDYFRLGNRTTASTPNSIWYDLASTSTTNLDNGQIFIYPRFFTGDKVIEFSYQRPFQDFDASTDHPDFPAAFYLPLMLELAALLGPKFGLAVEERAELRAVAKMYRDEALSTVISEGSIQFEKDMNS